VISDEAERFFVGLRIEDLRLEDVECPVPGRAGVVKVRAAGIQPGEPISGPASARAVAATFPSGQGSDLAGGRGGTGPHVAASRWANEVLGFPHTRASHAEFVAVNE